MQMKTFLTNPLDLPTLKIGPIMVEVICISGSNVNFVSRFQPSINFKYQFGR